METNQYLAMFIDEASEHLQSLNENLLELENNPTELAIVQHIFRSAHTLKGMSATMGYEDIVSLTHQMENVLDLVRNNKLSMDEFIFDTLFRSLDALESMVQDIVAGGTGQADVTAIVAQLSAIVAGNYQIGTDAAAGQPSAEQGENHAAEAIDEYQHTIMRQSIEHGLLAMRISVTIREDSVLKAARAYMVFDTLERFGDVVKAVPEVQLIEQDLFGRSFTVFFLSSSSVDEVSGAIQSISEIEAVEVRSLDAAALDQLHEVSMMSATVSAAAEHAATTQPAEAPALALAKDAKPAAPAKAAAAAGPVASKTIRVDIDRLDTLLNLFSELLIDRVRLEQLASEIRSSALTDTVEHMARVSGDLQNIVLKLRMVPVESVFNRFPRMVRDLAKTLDKKMEFVISGADTELDRTVVDEIGDPLVHLLRNSVDHGIEMPADRLQAGKPETGTIHLRAFHSGNHVFIEIEDDGGGINRPKVLQIALSKGIVSQEQANKMTDEEIDHLLFAPGFSTADKISDISGRGVGLDVVKTKISSLGGHISIQSESGVGTKFSVQLPLTLSIISAMLIKMGSEKFAIPLASIVETSLIRPEQLRTVHGTVMIDYRDQFIPLVSLAKVLDCPDYDEHGEEETEIIVIRKGDKLAALAVEEFIGQQEIVIKSLGKYLTNLFAVSGATILGDGQVALIIDTNALIK